MDGSAEHKILASVHPKLFTDDVVCFDCHSQFEARGAAAPTAYLA